MTTLHIHKQTRDERFDERRGEYWIDNYPTISGRGRKIYFREGSTELFNCAPTWFMTKAEARAAAEKMGFIVKETTRKRTRTLFIHKQDQMGYWIDSSATLGKCHVIYFRIGNSELFSHSPTWFPTKTKALIAAGKMGFKVRDGE